jgi:Putative adhesin
MTSKEHRMSKKTFATPGPVRLEVRSTAGTVTVEAVPGLAETSVTVEPSGSDEASRRAADEARIEMREHATTQEVIVDIRQSRRFGSGRGASVDIHIRCPDGACLDATSASAAIRSTGALGDVNARTASGPIGLAVVEGALTANTASGDIAVDAAGGLVRCNTASGGVTLRNAGAVVAKTASGHIRVEAVVAGRIELNAASGDLLVGVREGSRLWVDARSGSGRMTSEVDLGDAPSGDNDGPLVEIRARTASGDVSIVRAPAPERLRP